MKTIATLFTFLALMLDLSGQALKYHSGKIPDSLRYNAKAIIRDEEKIIDIQNESSYIIRERKAITVLNSYGENIAAMNIPYDQFHELTILKADIYNAQGILVTKISKENFADTNENDGFSLYTDGRYKTYYPSYKSFPYTIEYTYEIKVKYTLAFPSWYPQDQEDLAVEHSTLTIISDTSYHFRFKKFNFTGLENDVRFKKLNYHQWSVNNLKAYHQEDYSLPAEQLLPHLMLGPNNFEYRGIHGNFETWKNFGTWVHENLLKDRDVLPQSTIDLVKSITKDATSEKEKVKIIYEYMQSKTRYVSIQKGSGGILPARALDVDHQGYGDCKGLTNYTMALLKVAGIESYYSIVYAGKKQLNIQEDFSSMQGNHVILCVPLSTDTIWLECTSKTLPMGYLGNFTDNRLALVCKHDDAVVVRTKCYSGKDNKINFEGIFSLDSSGNLKGKYRQDFYGLFYSDREEINELSAQRKNEKLTEIYNLNKINITHYGLAFEKTEEYHSYEELECYMHGFCRNPASSIVFPLSPFIEPASIPRNHRSRVSDVYIRDDYENKSVVEYTIPENYRIDYVPKNKHFKNELCTYNLEITTEKDKIIITRITRMNHGIYPPETYHYLICYFKEIQNYNNQKIRLVKK